MNRLLSIAIAVLGASAHADEWKMSLIEAESQAVETSNQLMAFQATADGAGHHAEAQFANLLPRLTFDGTYQYNTHVPELTLPFPGSPELQFGDHYNYAVGPTLSYTLWDTGSGRDSYKSFRLLEQSHREDERSAKLQVVLSVRLAYVRLQLALEELRLLNNSLQLARAQNHDIESNFRGGAATRLDMVESQREVINYQLQFDQKQIEVESDFKDLLAFVQPTHPQSTSKPGPPGVPGVQHTLNLDRLDESLKATDRVPYRPPDDLQPSVHSQALLAEANERAASSQRASRLPIVQVSASAKMQYPDQINLQTIEQNSVMVSLSVPLFEGDRTSHLAAESQRQADAARFSENQTRINLERDYQKALAELESLRAQQKLAVQDVERSETAARLYYQSYRGGKINLTDVQGANNRALTAKVNAARIDAQILNQIFTLNSLSGEESHARQ